MSDLDFDRHPAHALTLALLAVTACAPNPVARPAPNAPALAHAHANANATGAGAAAPAPGITLELAEHRAATLSDVAYDLHLDVTDSARATGAVELHFARAANAGDLVVDFRGLERTESRANDAPVPAIWQDGHIVIPADRLRPGKNRLAFRFATPIAPAGASIIRYHDDTDGSTYLYSLLVPSDAHQLFPCFDQPDLKARLHLTVTAPAGWTVVANAPLETTAHANANANATAHAPASPVVWSFRETKPISTYLMAFAAGPWATPAPANEPVNVNANVNVNALFLRRSRLAELGADADTLLLENTHAREWLEEYFGVPFPFAKMDALLAPAFPFGGMEHVGAIFYNESRFIFREPPTPSQRAARASTIYHEVAHQWFGDLVTMRWFDDLWLKEGFATYMAARVQEALDPGAGVWVRFHLLTKPAAYAVDVTSGTTPVWQALPSLELAKSNYGPIVYNKAPAVLRQLEYLVGDDAFRAGVNLFLRRHAYANATWRDLLAAIGEAAGRDLTAFGDHYILRAGMPVVETELSIGDDGRIASLALVQRPARPLPGDPGTPWPGRVRVRLGYANGEDVLIPVSFDGERTVVPGAAGLPAPDFVLANDGDFGYGLFLADDRSARWLLDHAAALDDPLLRAIAWGSLWDLVREGRLAPQAFADRAIRALPGEADEMIAGALLDRTVVALQRYTPRDAAGELPARLEALLLARIDDDRLPYGLRKASLDALLAGARTPAGLAAVRAFLAGARTFRGEPVGQPARWTAVTRLLALGAPDADSILRAETARDTTPEAARSAFIAAAARPTAAAKAAYFARFLDDPSLNEEWVTASLGAFNDGDHAALTRPFLRPALEKADWIRQHRRIFFLPRWLEAFIGGQTSAAALAEVDAFLAGNPDLPPDVRRKILQSRDELARTVGLRGGAQRRP